MPTPRECACMAVNQLEVQRHCLVTVSQIRTVWSSEPDASKRLLCGWNLTVHGVRSWPVSTHSTFQVAQRNTCRGPDHAACKRDRDSLHRRHGGADGVGGTRPHAAVRVRAVALLHGRPLDRAARVLGHA